MTKELADALGRLPIVSLRQPSSPDTIYRHWSVPFVEDSDWGEVRDDWWSGTFGDVQAEFALTKSPIVIVVDLSNVEWADPLPLLSLLVAIKGNCQRTFSELRLQLGSFEKATTRRRSFLSFLEQHGFLSSLVGLPQLTVDFEGKRYSEQRLDQLRNRLRAEPLILTYPDSRCLTAKISCLSRFTEDTDKAVSLEIREWLEEFKNYGLGPYFEGEAELVDDMLHKVRVLLTEIIHNAVEHAYHERLDPANCFFGIFARVRRSVHFGAQPSKLVGALRLENKNCPTLSQFHRDIQCSWIELFYVDEGRGMLADLKKWIARAPEELRLKLSRIDVNSNALQQVSQYFFQQPISRHQRDARTILTGLQHIRLVLSDGEDFARVYSEGEWVGSMHPWSKSMHGGAQNVGKQAKYGSAECAHGSAWHYCLKLEHGAARSEDKRFDKWQRLTVNDVEPTHDDRRPYSDWRVFDERDLGAGIDYRDWRNEDLNHPLCLWLPGAVTKQHVYQWITAVLRKQKLQSSVWLIADLSREQAHTLEAVLLSEMVRPKSAVPDINVYLVTSDWYIRWLKTNQSKARLFAPARKDLLQRLVQRSASIFRLLRTHDSHLFWKGLIDLQDHQQQKGGDPIGSAFIREDVIWQRRAIDDEPSVRLGGYLDLTHALSDSMRIALASRALRRTWHLFAGNAECVAADTLLTNLLPREARLALAERGNRTQDPSKPQVVVSSILVTGSTAHKCGLPSDQAIHLLRHGQFELGEELIPESIQKSDRYALNWMAEKIALLPCPVGELPYERIPGTPYIGRGGAKAIPIRRFDRAEGRAGPYFTRSIVSAL